MSQSSVIIYAIIQWSPIHGDVALITYFTVSVVRRWTKNGSLIVTYTWHVDQQAYQAAELNVK